MNKSVSQMDLVREAFHYQSRFDGSTMVFKIDFPVTEDPLFPYLMKDLALLAKTGFRVVIVPGAKEWIDSVLGEYGIQSRYAGSTRITSAEAIPFAAMAAFHTAARFMTGLSAGAVDAVIGNLVRARGLGVVEGVDMEHTGKVDKILTDSIRRILNLGMVPILPCIGYSPSGKPYNVPSDEIALEASVALGAVKLFIVSVHQGLRGGDYKIPENIELDGQGRIIRLTPPEAETVLELNPPGREPDRPLAELRLALQASRSGVERIHLIDGREEGAVLRELFSNLGAGTMVYADEYEAIRGLRTEDIPDVLRLMEPLMQQGILVRRNAEDIQEKTADYVVFDIDGSIHACAALHHQGGGQGEIAAVATDPAYTDRGLGRRMVRFLIDRAVKQGCHRVFVLTIRTHDWFESLGFKECSVESLPPLRRKNYDQRRNSKIFAVDLR
ncbi:MAG: amino-acid N-acetyltransferase [Spirochaetaceae bacterium]|jgi:amino-acid N-acetyltransferase|nr:amino-acid N-acetyltransferase [Spirochaetaceae bacterium]